MNMRMDDILKDMLVKQEAWKKKPYKDSVGKLTIGVGRNLDDKGLNDDEIALMLSNDIRDAKNDLYNNLPWACNLSDLRQVVLVNMCFNMGIGRLLMFKKMLRAVETGDYIEAAKEMLDSNYATQVGNRAIYLAKVMETNTL